MDVSLPDPQEMIGKRRIFVSGHSLTARPMPDFLQEITAVSGLAISWDGQHADGSSIKDRSFGQDPSRPWTGFERGQSASGNAANVLATLKKGAVDDKPYDVLLITEQHGLLDALLWQDTKRYLRAYRDRFISFSPQAEILFFTPWISLSDKNDLSDWITYERAAWPVWRCAVADVNQGLKGVEGSRPIGMIPASLALAALLENLQQNPDQPGFERLKGRHLTDAFFSDTVHLTPLGSYFVAALTASALYGDLPAKDYPRSIPAEQAMTLQRFAANFIAANRRSGPTFGVECSKTVGWAFVAHYTGYVEKAYHREEMGYVRAKLRRVRNLLRFALAV
ncbi:hypothetical protein ACQKP1_14000 [Allorhizobium sp. NPDC080224]|uniref:hypothetical protein n=1 Tax=Allorhizobium sp. NPDC080224 TaxID=3390547 RepID=UPI003D07EEE7